MHSWTKGKIMFQYLSLLLVVALSYVAGYNRGENKYKDNYNAEVQHRAAITQKYFELKGKCKWIIKNQLR